MHSQCARVFFFRVYLSLSSLSLFTKIFLFKPPKSKTFLHHDEETVRERDKSVSDVLRIYAAKLPRTKPSLEARKGNRQTRRQRRARLLEVSQRGPKQLYTVVKWNPYLKRHRRSRSENSSNAYAKPPIANSNWYSTRYRGTTGNRSHRSKRNERSCIT